MFVNVIVWIGILSCVFIWLDITNIPMYIKKVILSMLLLYACICGYYEFPNSADFSAYLGLYYMQVSSDFDFFAYREADQSENLDKGFFWLWTLVKSLGGDIYISFFITCSISLYFYYKGICRCTKYIFCAWSIILVRLFYVSNIVQIRQGLAAAILIFSFKYIEEKNFRSYLLCVSLATLCHHSFIVTILFYPFGLISWTRTKCLFVIVLSMLAALLNGGEILFAAADVIGYGSSRILMYTGQPELEPLNPWGIIIRQSVILIFILYLLRWKTLYANSFIGMLLLGFFFTSIFSSYPVMQRLGNNFLLCVSFAPTYLFSESNKLWYKILIIITIEMICIFAFFKNYVVGIS